ncbi:MAG: hypothetical protein PHQ96_07335 [Candidatus Omnitrophica bacterium]|nr:hypothetical protein [Candidatus Omnitrophota bacterium]
MRRFTGSFATIILCFIFSIVPFKSYPEKLTVIYTGNSHASLYPCGHCPASVGGGIARRAHVIDEIRSSDKNVIILDGGNLVAGGSFDEASENSKNDMTRSDFYLSTLASIGYDALGVGEAEINFGTGFLEEKIKKYNLNFVSSNVDIKGVLPYYIKEFKAAPASKAAKAPSLRVAVVGLSPLEAYKHAEVKAEDYETALQKTIVALKGKADFIILLSALGDAETSQLAKKISGIQLVITSGPDLGGSPENRINDTLILKSSYMAKQLGVVELNIEGGKINDWKSKTRRLSLDIPEAQKIKNMMPACFADSDCPNKEGLVSSCQKPAELSSACAYFEATKIEAIVITATGCPFCSTSATEQLLKSGFLGINFRVIDYKDKEAQELIKKYAITTLPAFILPAKIKEEKNFQGIEKFVSPKQGSFLVRRELSGMFLFLGRKEAKGKIDFFLNMHDKEAASLYGDLLDFAKKKKVLLDIHFILPLDEKSEIPKEEVKMALAVKKLYPAKYFEYLRERLQTIDSIYWIEIMEKLGIDYKKVSQLAKSNDAQDLFNDNMKLTQELGVTDGGVLLINNTMVFKLLKLEEEDLNKFFQ